MNENAPEKIYRTTTYLHKQGGQTVWKRQPVAGAENIEYVRTEVLVERAEEYIYKQLNEGRIECGNIENFIKGFKNYMKGE